MKKRLTELVEKKFLTSEEIGEIYSMSEVDKVEYNEHDRQKHIVLLLK